MRVISETCDQITAERVTPNLVWLVLSRSHPWQKNDALVRAPGQRHPDARDAGAGATGVWQ